MPPRRGASGLRPHSRSSSATRLGANLQFTQSKAPASTTTQQQPTKPPSRISSAQRISSREPVAAYTSKHPQRSTSSRQHPSTTTTAPATGTTGKSKPGFTLSQSSPSSDSDEEESASSSSSGVDDTQIYDENEGDDDEWVSSESGAQTPNSNDGSDTGADSQRDKERETERRREEALRRLLTSGDLGQAPPTTRSTRAEVVDAKGATAETPLARNHLSQPPPRAANLTRVDTARQEEISRASSAANAREQQQPARPHTQMPPPPVPAAAMTKAANGSQQPAPQPRSNGNGDGGPKLTIQTTSPTPPSSNNRTPAPQVQLQQTSTPNSPRPREPTSRKHSSQTRPGSGYSSRHSSGDVSHHGHGHQQPLRPHPLIRGQSFGLGGPGSGRSTPAGLSSGAGGGGGIAPLTPKHAPLPSQLQPLTVIQDSNGMLSGSPTDERSHHTHYLSSSPTGSVQTVLTSPGSPEHGKGGRGGGRRTSVSSVHSSMTLPIQSSTWSLPGGSGGGGAGHDRKRTTSSLSHSSSAAALSSLVSNPSSSTLYPTALSSLSHLPSVTRPPSPQQISFFPPLNTQVRNEIEGIHPLLPPPYIGNHLAVLARRNPVWESWERVGRAKREMRSY